MIYINVLIFIIAFGVCFYVAKRDKRNRNIKATSARIMSVIVDMAYHGDEFASCLSTVDLLVDLKVKAGYDFLDYFEWDKKLTIDSEDSSVFWKKYKEEKKRFKSDKRYKIYKLFLKNLTRHGKIIVLDDGSIYLVVYKYYYNPGEVVLNYTSWPNSAVHIALGAGGGGGGGFYYLDAPDLKRNDKLKCEGFEKIRQIWHNTVEEKTHTTFIIKENEIDDFYSMCELICGEELSW